VSLEEIEKLRLEQYQAEINAGLGLS
jgi:hypothetical protein